MVAKILGDVREQDKQIAQVQLLNKAKKGVLFRVVICPLFFCFQLFFNQTIGEF